MGIIGYGNIGSQVSVMAESLGMKVIFYDSQKKLPIGNALAVDSLIELLRSADIISITYACRRDCKQYGANPQETVLQCKKGAILINYARGEATDMNAVKSALEEQACCRERLSTYI